MCIMNMKKHASKYRKPISRLFFIIVLFFILFTQYSWQPNSILDIVVETIGFILVVLCSLGRIWSGLYIEGKKNNELVTKGPYSMVRNPLYLFSFLGALGIGFSSKSLIVLLLLVGFFALYYPLVIKAEEEKLQELYQEKFLAYKKSTPRFMPDFSKYYTEAKYLVNVKRYIKSFLDVMWFFWFYIFLRIIEVMHINGIIPVFYKIP